MDYIRRTIGDYHPSLEGSEKRKPFCIFLTATIAPPQAAVSRYDPEVRLQDYLRSLEYYLSLPSSIVDRILFVDNSGSDITRLESFVRARSIDKSVEFLSFQGNDHPVSYGKAYGEFKLLDFGVEHTSLLAERDYFWKITGRLRVVNLLQLLAQVPKDYDVLCDLHNFPFVGTGKKLNNRWMDLRLFSCKVKAYKAMFAGKYAEFGAAINQESLYDVVMAGKAQLKVFPRFQAQPVISGVSGRHERDYHQGMQRVKTAIRSVIRRTTPSFWV